MGHTLYQAKMMNGEIYEMISVVKSDHSKLRDFDERSFLLL